MHPAHTQGILYEYGEHNYLLSLLTLERQPVTLQQEQKDTNIPVTTFSFLQTRGSEKWTSGPILCTFINPYLISLRAR